MFIKVLKKIHGHKVKSKDIYIYRGMYTHTISRGSSMLKSLRKAILYISSSLEFGFMSGNCQQLMSAGSSTLKVHFPFAL